MKTKNLLVLCGSAIASGMIAGMMYAVRGLLPELAVKALMIIIILASLTALYAIAALVKRVHAIVTDIRLKHLDHHERSQRLLMDTERHELEMLALRADVHIKLSRLAPDANGYYPALLPGTFVIPAELAGNVLMLPPAQLRGTSERVQIAQQDNNLQPVAIPTAPLFREVMPYIKGEQVVMAYDHTGVVLGQVLDWLSTLVVGMPGMGKSTALYFFIAQLMMLTAKFQVLDPHASLISLKSLLPYVNRVDACIQTAPLIEEELEQRMDRYEANNGVCLDPHYMLIVDELPSIADREDQLLKKMDRREKGQFRSLIDVLRRVVCEGRKYNMYCMIVGQSIPASILPTIARDNMSSRYVFNCSADHARMAGLDRNAIDTFLPSLDGNVGRCIVAAARMKAFLGAIPLTDVNDLRYVIETTGYTRDGWDSAEAVSSGGNSGNKDTEPMEALPVNVSVFPKNNPLARESDISESGNTETPLPEGVTSRDLEQILRAYHANWPLRDIAKLVKMEGRNYSKFKAACDYLGISPKVATNE